MIMVKRVIQILLLSSILLQSALMVLSQAQINLDGSLGPQGPLRGPDYRIDADMGQLHGSNLFHSFGQFTLRTGESATFAGPNTIANIVGRVTGGQPSAIDGLLRSAITGANLFLLNPSGILFGPNASLDVSGSFHVSTADVLRFADGVQFSAHLGQESILAMAPPAAFGFLGTNPAAITIQGSTLEVRAGNTLSVVGGDIMMAGSSLQAPSGRIQLVSVASPAEVEFSPLELAPNLQVGSVARLGRIALSQRVLVDASGNGAGTVLVRSGRLLIDQSNIFADNLGELDSIGVGVDLRVAADAVIRNRSFITTDRLGAGRARDLQIRAGLADIDASGIGSRGDGSGNGGNVLVDVGTLMLTGGSQIIADTSNAGHGGEMTVTATDSIFIAGRGFLGRSGLFSNTFGRGDAGRITISVPMLHMEGGRIQAGVAPDRSGSAGALDVRVGRLTLTGGGQISTSSFGTGRAGNVTVAATESISMAGRDREGNLSGLFSGTQGAGLGGDLRITAPQIQLSGGATISARSLGASDAGNIIIQAGQLFLSDNSVVTTEAVQGEGGNIALTAGSLVDLRDSQLTATVKSGVGQGGNIAIDPQAVVLQRSQIRADAFGGPGGNVSLVADVFLADPDSQVSASSALGIQGTVEIQAPVTSLSGAVAPLPQAFVNVVALLPTRCAARFSGGRASSLVLGGRDGPPLEPSGVLPSPLVLEERLAADPALTAEPRQQSSPARFTFLAGQEKALPRLQGDQRVRGCPK